jgi:catechol 2,3-dioxygenase-like lactoylglutathione lyase family enzyme
MLGHLGLSVPDLAAARDYYGELLPMVGYEEFLAAPDRLGYRPAQGKPGTFMFFYRAEHAGPYATFWLDPHGFKLEAVCHHDRD